MYDSVLVAAEGIKKAMKSGKVLPSTQSYQGFCSSSRKELENISGKELARHLNEVNEVKNSIVKVSFYGEIYSLQSAESM